MNGEGGGVRPSMAWPLLDVTRPGEEIHFVPPSNGCENDKMNFH